MDAAPRLDETQELLSFFEFKHLPEDLQVVSRAFHDVAHWLAENVPRNRERTVALRKLLEGKDAAVRAKMLK